MVNLHLLAWHSSYTVQPNSVLLLSLVKSTTFLKLAHDQKRLNILLNYSKGRPSLRTITV